MAEAIVGPLLIKLQDVAIREAKKLAAVGGEIEKLSDKLMWLQAMVHETDLRSRHDGSRLVRVLACQIRDVAFEAEDSVDEFYLRGDLCRRFGLSRRFGRNWWRATVEFIIYFRTHICVRFVLSSSIESMHARLEEIANNNSKYGMGHHQGRSSDGMTWRASRAVPLIRDDWEDSVSFKLTHVSAFNELKEKLMDESGSKVIHICGVGGVGKRALLGFASEDTSIKEHFHVCVCVSFPPGIRDNSGTIVNQMEEKLDKACSWCNTARRDACYLVIIKSPIRTTTWSQVESKLLQMVGQGSKILLTEASRHEEPNRSSSINLGPLDNARSISFFNHVYGLGGRKGTDYQTRQMNKIRLMIMEITNGLPLAIVLLAKLMRTMDFSKWEAAAAYLMSNNEDSKLKTILSVCIDDLPDELKSCLLYTSGFPENGIIDAHQLVRLWMAEGFLTHQQGMETEQLGQCYLKELIYRGLLELIEKTSAHGGRIESVAIHDKIHPLLRLEAKRTSFMDVHHGGCIPPPANTRRLAVQDKYINKSLALSNSLSKLRTMVSYSDDYLDHETGSEQTNESINDNPTLIRNLLHGSPFLRVVNLEGINVISKVPDEIGEMVHLQYLGIRRCRLVEKVPSSIGNLGRLQTIDVRDTKVRKLPKSLWKIRTLRHVLGDDVVFPASTGDLKLMQTLQSVTIRQEGVRRAMWWCTSAGRRRKQFGLRLLQSLRIVGLDASQREELKGFSSLESLSLSGEGIPIDLFATESSYLDHVASLELDGKLLPPNRHYNYFCDFDACRAVLKNLTRLVLRRTNIAQDCIHSIAKLPLLAELEMQEGSYIEEKVIFCTDGFNSLAVLRITSLVTLKIVTAPGVTTRRHKVIQPIYTDMPESHSESHDSSFCGFCNARGQAGDNQANRNEEESHLASQITTDHDVVPLVLPPAVESQINGGEQGDEDCDVVAMLPAGEKNDSGREEEDGMELLPQTDHEKLANEGMPMRPAKEKQANGGEEEEEDEGEHYEEMILNAINGLLKEDELSKTNKTKIREYIEKKRQQPSGNQSPEEVD